MGIKINSKVVIFCALLLLETALVFLFIKINSAAELDAVHELLSVFSGFMMIYFIIPLMLCSWLLLKGPGLPTVRKYTRRLYFTLALPFMLMVFLLLLVLVI